MHPSCPTIFELRQYTLRPGRRDELIDLFEREFVEPQEAVGIELVGLFCDADRPDRFVWLRGFRDMTARKRALESFYGGSVWKAHRDAANATMIDSDNVLLLHLARPESGFDRAMMQVRGPLLCLAYSFTNDGEREAFVDQFVTGTRPQLARKGASVLATFVTEPSANTYPNLPVREGEHSFVVLVDGISIEQLALGAKMPTETAELVPTTRSRIQWAFAGRPRDFDFLVGSWNVTHRRLRERLRGSSDWEVLGGTHHAYALVNGLVSVDEFDFPSKRSKGCSIRHLDLVTQRWSIYWMNSETGKLAPPVRGGFAGDRGEFYGSDVEGGTPVLARFVWRRTPRTPRWEQAFSTDGGETWETNWIMEFRRVPSGDRP